ncbi:hypothetical protein NliqN6_5225 [Naganishia liquefaciens]|uniref:SWIM-type domain-containing protein n=1 Tax=Naganishia liquefaciens TaxID=104408 RepID=A0A8H3YGZ7_9TREE|nr:hypothetical protein NliqN6_5225 [Naganishia liquefaciens]
MPPSRAHSTPTTPPHGHHVDPPSDRIPRDSSPLTSPVSPVSTPSSPSPVPAVYSALARRARGASPRQPPSQDGGTRTIHRPPAKAPRDAGPSPRRAQTRPGVPVDHGPPRQPATRQGADRVVERGGCKAAPVERHLSGMEGEEDEDEDQQDGEESLMVDGNPPINLPQAALARKRRRQEIHDDEMHRLDGERERLVATLQALDDDDNDEHFTRTSTPPTLLTTSPAVAAAAAAAKACAHATHLTRIALAAARTAAASRTRAAAVVARRAERDRVVALARAEEEERKAGLVGEARGGARLDEETVRLRVKEEEAGGEESFECGWGDSMLRCAESMSGPWLQAQGLLKAHNGQVISHSADTMSTNHADVQLLPTSTMSDKAQRPSYPAKDSPPRASPNPTTTPSWVSASQPAPARSWSQNPRRHIAHQRLGIQRPHAAAPDTRPTSGIFSYGYSMADAPETSALLAEIEALSQSVPTGRSALELTAQLDSRSGNSNASAGPLAFPLSSSAPSSAGPSRHHLAETGTGRRTPRGKGKVPSPVKVKSIVPVDKRPAMFRKRAPVAVLERAERVRSQRMFMVHQSRHPQHLCATMHILGSTGNVYTVEFGQRPTCDCPDFAKGNHCKHIIFVALKVLRMPEHGTLWYQKAYTQAELCEIFDSAPPNAFDSVTAPANIQQVFRQHLGLESAPAAGTSASAARIGNAERDGQGKRTPNDGDECPICSDEMQVDGRGANELVYDLGVGGCGRALHKQCFQMWAVQERKKAKQPTCVYCRHPWSSGVASGAATGNGLQTADGYLNMAELAGMSRYRDTSSYYRGPRRGKGRWQTYGYDDEGFW